MYKLPGEPCNEIRTLHIHECETGWFFTVHKNVTLLYQSQTHREREKVVSLGIEYLDALREETNG